MTEWIFVYKDDALNQNDFLEQNEDTVIIWASVTRKWIN